MRRPAPRSSIVALGQLGQRVIACHRMSSVVRVVVEVGVAALKRTRRGSTA